MNLKLVTCLVVLALACCLMPSEAINLRRAARRVVNRVPDILGSNVRIIYVQRNCSEVTPAPVDTTTLPEATTIVNTEVCKGFGGVCVADCTGMSIEGSICLNGATCCVYT